MLRIFALIAASDMLGTSLDIENSLPLEARLLAALIGGAIMLEYALREGETV